MKKVAIIVTVIAVLVLAIFIITGIPGVSRVFERQNPSPVNTIAVSQVAATPEPTALPVVKSSDQVVAQGKLVPIRYVNLSFNTAGLVALVTVSEGEVVEAGQLIAQLSGREQYEAAVVTAQLELVNAQQAIKDLYANAPYEAAQLLQQLAQAPKAVEEAQRKVDSMKRGGSASTTDIDVAAANLALAEKKLREARAAYEPWANKSPDSLQRAALLNKLAEAQQAYDSALRAYNALTGGPTQANISLAEADLEFAKATLADLQRRYDILKNGPDPDQVTLAQARLKNAEAQLVVAQAALSTLELRAPFAGTIASLSLKVGEYVAPGVPVAMIVDTSQWRVETTDLTELNIVRVNEGSTASITFDALPDISFPAKVFRIKTMGENRQGDITYTVILDIGRIDERLRWNMTCSVLIYTQQ